MPLPSATGVNKKRRNKSFAGCWTCRARKVKCDEGRPICQQCHIKNLSCEGYEVRLRWMPLEAGSSGGDGRDLLEVPSPTPSRAQRSLIACDEPTEPPLQLSELDQIFSQIDSFQSSRNSPYQDPETHLVVANFGVFDFGVFDSFNVDHRDGWSPSPETTESVDDTVISASIATATESWLPQHSLEVDSHMTLEVDSHMTESIPSGSPPDDFGSLPQHTIATFVNSGSVTHSVEDISQDLDDAECDSPELHEFQQPTSTALLCHADEGLQISHPSFWWKADSGAIVHNPSPYILPELERFLMNHYVHRVVHLFCVIDNAKSPWKTIHLPRVLQSAGDLSLHGSTSAIRQALRNALLSISAFYLSNDSRQRTSNDEADRWARHAIKFRGHAIKLLKETVESSTPESPPKYKELLATMLSMITINVMSGEMSTTGIHLDGAFRFMNHARATKSKYSSKARSLHRVYFYLRVIYDSTSLRGTQGPGSPGSPDTDFGTSLKVALQLLDKTDDEPFSLLSHIAAPRGASYECVYGVPQSLLVLLARATDLIDQVASAGGAVEHARADLAEQCDALESDILDWSPHFLRRGTGSSGERLTPSDEIIQKTTAAFHNALIIYFAQHVRLMRHSYLRTNIQNVIQNIEDIETIKSESGILAGPLYWPAFIAGSEAFDKRLQDRFRRWYERVESYQFASMRTDITVLTEVWKEGPGQQRMTSLWRAVVQRTGARLMLS